MSVQTLIDNAQAYATNVKEEAIQAFETYNAKIDAIPYTVITYDPSVAKKEINLPDAPKEYVAPTFAGFNPVEFSAPSGLADAPTYQNVSPVVLGALPTFSVATPTVNLPNRPNQVKEFLDSPPAINTDLKFPTAPDQLSAVFEAPNIAVRVAPVKPQISLPGFTAVAPIDNTTAPSDLSGEFQRAYGAAGPSTIAMVNGYVDAMLAKYNPRYAEQMAAIETQLAKYLAGGTALNPDVEDAIYSRAQEKNDVEARRVQDAAFADMAARGFTMPNGTLNATLARARQEAANNNAKAANEIAIAQAEMEQRNLQFAVTTSTGLRTAMLNATLSYMQNLVSINGQAIDYAKSLLNAMVESYNISVRVFQAKLDLYRAEASVYEVRLKGALAGIELYTAEVNALQALTNVDMARVSVYKARVESLSAYANAYRAQIEAVQSQASLEKLKLELFQSQVQAYGAQVQAKNAEWQGYTAAISGEEAKVRVYNSQVSAYQAQIQGYTADVSAKTETVRAEVAVNQARATQYAAQVQAYNTVVDATSAVARTKLENERQKIVAYQAEVAASTAAFGANNEYYKTHYQVMLEQSRLTLDTMFKSAENVRNTAATVAQLSAVSGQTYASMASAAMSGMNTLSAELKNE
jgi:hypothetical protein